MLLNDCRDGERLAKLTLAPPMASADPIDLYVAADQVLYLKAPGEKAEEDEGEPDGEENGGANAMVVHGESPHRIA
jgi:hypothetical protein